MVSSVIEPSLPSIVAIRDKDIRMKLNMYGALRIVLWIVAIVCLLVVVIFHINEYGLDTRSLSHGDFPTNWVEDPSVTLTIHEMREIAGKIEVTAPVWMFWRDTATQLYIEISSSFALIILFFTTIMFTTYIDWCLRTRREGVKKYR